MKKLTYLTLAVFYFVLPAQAQDVISLNFVRNTGVGIIDPADVAGVIPVDNWNTAEAFNADVEDVGWELVDNAGNQTTAIALWQSGAASWSVATAGDGSDGDKVMMTGYLDQSGNGLGQIHMVEVSDIPFDTYDLYLYHSSSGGSNRAARYQANGIDLFTRNLEEQNVFNEFILDQHDSLEESNDSDDGGNYVLWTGLSGDLFIEGEGIGVEDGALLGGNTRRAPIQGIQIVSSMPSACDPNSMGDLDGNGTVEFADFLVLSENFGSEAQDHTTGDIDCNGIVEFADFLVLSENFGATEVAAQSVPEPSSCSLFGFVVMTCCLLRRRRR